MRIHGFAALAMLALLGACASRGTGPAPTMAPTTMPTEATTEAPAPTAIPLPPTALPQPSPTLTPSGPPTVVPTLGPGVQLPSPLVFLDTRQQLSRVTPDGATTELTSDAGNVVEFDVSPADGSLVYTLLETPSSMLLQRIGADGKGQQELARGYFRSLMFEPDGRRLLFAVDVEGARAGDTKLPMGVWAMPIAGGTPEQLVADVPPDTDVAGQLIPGLRYAPAGWSPDGQWLLLLTAPDFGPDLPAGDIGVVGLSVLNRADGSIVQLLVPGAGERLCLLPVWSAASDAIYCAAPYSVGDPTPALFRLDLTTGVAEDLIPRIADGGRELGIQALRVDQDQLTIVATYSEGGQPAGAAIERFTDDPARRTVVADLSPAPGVAESVFWAPDGSGLAYVTFGERTQLIWLSFGQPPQVLADGLIGRLRWGK